LQKRNIDAAPLFEEVLLTDETRRSTQAKLDNILAESNKISKEIGILFKNGMLKKQMR
jgi:seryl-tRNA synthetase